MAANNVKSKNSGNNSAPDWQLGKTVLECNKHMFENNIDCDVTFSFPTSEGPRKSMEGNILSAHKYVLVSRSPVFYAMLSGPARDESGRINIEDINMDSFREMLRSVINTNPTYWHSYLCRQKFAAPPLWLVS